MADILCDASSLISLSKSCFLNVLNFLHNSLGTRFFIPPAVEFEMVERPLKIKTKKYSLSALKLKHAMVKKTIMKIDSDVKDSTKRILNIANNIFFVSGKPMNIVHLGEVEMIALAKHLNLTSLLVDERTTRMIIESPFKYKKHLEEEFKVNVMVNKQNLKTLQEITKDMKIIRSSELLVVAFENGFLDSYKDLKYEVLEAGLYSLKYGGCSVRFDEIHKILRKLN